MSGEEHSVDLLTRFGTTSPFWRLSNDSNTLELATVRGPANVGVPLQATQAAQVRALTGVTSHLTLELNLFGESFQLHLIGKKINTREWAGTASDYADTASVARDLMHGLAFAEQVVSEVNSLLVILDQHGSIKRFNRMCEEVTGLREEDVVGESAHNLFMSDDEAKTSRSSIAEYFTSSEPYQVERFINTLNGPRLFVFRNKFVQGEGGIDQRFLICSGTDITEERKAQRLLVQQATTDELTGLLNRKALYEAIENAIAVEKWDAINNSEQDMHLGVLFLDLDNFKKVNDCYGHVVGDWLIKQVGAKIKNCLLEEDVLGRLGGDEFLIVVKRASIPLLVEKAETIQAILQVPFDFGLLRLYTGCSLGIALFPEHGDRLESLIRSADTAMYVAKDSGKRTYRVFTPEMDMKVADDVWLDTHLRKALEDGELALEYQPKVCLRTGSVECVEALVRWHSTERGEISPRQFIPYAEHSGLISPLGNWVMQTAAKQAARWQGEGLDLRISFNVSARQLQETDFVKEFAEIITKSGLEPCTLDVELTESCIIEEEAIARVLIGKIRNMGARVHLDDFGTGYSSLSQLANVSPDAIKLDRSFINGISLNHQCQVLVRAIAAVAHELCLTVIAEGVESEADAEFLRGIGVDYAQGFLYLPPVGAKELQAWMNGREVKK